jgi:hypothetical protein
MAFGIGDAISLAGSFFGGGGSTGRKDAAVVAKNNHVYNLDLQGRAIKHANQWNWINFKEAQRQYERSLTKTIQSRVADAKKAGIHPLYALGQPGAGSVSFNTVGAPGGSSSPVVPVPEGENVGTANAIAGILNRKERRAYEAQVRARQQRIDAISARESYYRSYKDWALAQEALSHAARARQQVNVNQDGGGRLQDKVMGTSNKRGLAETVNDEMISASKRDPSTTAGKSHPPYRNENLGYDEYGYPIMIHGPADGSSELDALAAVYARKAIAKGINYYRNRTPKWKNGRGKAKYQRNAGGGW